MKVNVVAIDGPAYVGKSQIAKALSQLTGFPTINTGHMYRSIAKWCMERDVSPAEIGNVRNCALQMEFSFENGRTIVNGEDWTEQLDHTRIVGFASEIAVDGEVRKILTAAQQQIASAQAVIMEGRDIGSVVFPNARWKFFVTASLEVRAKRMLKMMNEEEKRNASSLEVLQKRVQAIDDADRNRKIAPLVQAEDAIVYDNSESPDAGQDARVLHNYMTGAVSGIHR